MRTEHDPPEDPGEGGTEEGVIVTRVSRIWLGGDGILRVVNHPGAEFTLEDAVEGHEATMKITGGRRVSILVDISRTASITREARSYYAGKDMKKTILARGLIVGSPLSRIIGSFFLALHRPADPTRLFTSGSEALEWLKRFIE